MSAMGHRLNNYIMTEQYIVEIFTKCLFYLKKNTDCSHSRPDSFIRRHKVMQVGDDKTLTKLK